MNYEVEFEHSALLDLKEATFYEVQFVFSVDKAKERMYNAYGNESEGFPRYFTEPAPCGPFS